MSILVSPDMLKMGDDWKRIKACATRVPKEASAARAEAVRKALEESDDGIVEARREAALRLGKVLIE